ncbi:unnamed protein product [Penicillium palitans]
MSLLNVPPEVILLLVPHLEYENEINALCRTTRRFYALLNPILYKRSISRRNGGYTLEWAAINGSAPTARLILKAGALLAACGGEPWQPFALAAIHGHSDIIRLLYEHGVDPCSINNHWKNDMDDGKRANWEEGHPLSMAASHGHVSVVNILLKYGMRPDLPAGHNVERTSIHLAAMNGHLDVVRVLSDAGSAIDAQDWKGATPLAFAAGNGHLDIVQFLLSRGADPNIATEHEGTSLCMASHSDFDTPVLLRAIHEGHKEAVTTLLAHGANPNYPSEVLLTAITNPPIFSLLSHNADPTGSLPESNLLIHAVYSGNVDTLRILLDHPKGTQLVMHSISVKSQTGAKPTSLFYAALYGGEGVFRLLLDRGLLTAPKHIFHQTAGQYLTLAVHGGIPLVRLLLAMGVSVHAGFNEGYLINLAATVDKDPEGLLDFLLERGCSIDDPDSMGRTAFFLAAYNDDKNVTRRLLERGADPLAVWEGDAALSVVARYKDVGAVEVILRAFDERGLSLGEVEGALKQAQDYALEDGRADIARALHRFYWQRRYPLSP